MPLQQRLTASKNRGTLRKTGPYYMPTNTKPQAELLLSELARPARQAQPDLQSAQTAFALAVCTRNLPRANASTRQWLRPLAGRLHPLAALGPCPALLSLGFAMAWHHSGRLQRRLDHLLPSHHATQTAPGKGAFWSPAGFRCMPCCIGPANHNKTDGKVRLRLDCRFGKQMRLRWQTLRD